MSALVTSAFAEQWWGVTMTIDQMICPDCGYDLRGIESERCPECGQSLDRELLSRSSIPWSYRHEIGRWRAYWRTVALAIRRPSALAAEIMRPVDFTDALKFRRLTAFIAAIVPMIALIVMYVMSNLTPTGPTFGNIFGNRPPAPDATLPPMHALGWAMEFLVIAAACGAIWLFLFAAAGAASYFFHPEALPMGRQNRAVALSYYSCAPLALTPVTLLLLLTFLLGSDENRFRAPTVFVAASVVLTVIVAIAQAIATFSTPLRLLARSTHCSSARVFALGIGLPVMWLILGAVILVGIPAAVGFLSLVVLSLAS